MEWRDKDGNIHKIEEMELNHLINAMKFAQNRIESLEFSSKLSSLDSMRIKYLKESVENFRVELRERR